ncbi:MAG: sulfite exporter TauE/SafE family protein [Ignavibacteriae bacterium]|nr:sulfite exporter TauE/SafE family protein [Ignavibacteriota bacterium]
MSELVILISTAVTLGFIHTIVGPDHYIPFIAIAKARNWTNLKVIGIVSLCGLGHILSSVIIGLIGIALGITISSIESFESSRGEIAGWLLIGFGLLYMLWGIKKAIRNKHHSHIHFHPDGNSHEHEHTHEEEHLHIHTSEKKNITPWMLFIIFAFGPCEPLIPLLMYPAAKQNYFAVAVVTALFGIVTIATMLTMTFIGMKGINLIPMPKLERHIHALSGFAILLCGVSIIIFGL